MAGETDLAKILRTLTVGRRDEPVTVVCLPGPVEQGPGIGAVIEEAEGTTVIVALAEAERRGWPIGLRAAWLTVQAHTSLDGIGLTAALSSVLADRSIACNVVAGYHHDHLLVPLDRVDEAIEALESLARPGS